MKPLLRASQFGRYIFVIVGLAFAAPAFSMTSSCFEYYELGSSYPHIGHEVSYSAQEAALGPQVSIATYVYSPFYLQDTPATPVNTNGGTKFFGGPVTSQGFYSFSGQGYIGYYEAPDFHFAVESFPCSFQKLYSVPQNPFISISPKTVYDGALVTFNWGAIGATDCLWNSQSIGPHGPAPIVVSPADSGTYVVNCYNIFGFALPVADTLAVSPPEVEILSANLSGNTIQVRLSGTSSGNLTVSLVGSQGSHQVHSSSKSAGTHSISFGTLSAIPEAAYSQIQATWSINGSPSDSFSYTFRALGNYRHTQYNVPAETACAGSAEPVYITNSSCSFSPSPLSNPAAATFRTPFRYQVALNGSGTSINFGNVKYEDYCMQSQFSPPADARGYPYNENVGNTFRGNESAPTGALGGPLNSSTVAVHSNHPFVEINDTIYIDGFGQKTVTDYCPDCTTNNYHHLDNFKTDPSCGSGMDLTPSAATFLIN